MSEQLSGANQNRININHSHHTVDTTQHAAIWLLGAVGHDGQVPPGDRVELRPNSANLHVHEGESGRPLLHL